MTTRRSYAKSPRLENDQYFTPAWMTLALLRRPFLNFGAHTEILEPCNGDGAISRILKERPGVHVLTNDLHLPADYRLDATLPSSWEVLGESEPDFVVGNPPFDAAYDIIRNAVEVARVGVAMILRLSWAEPTIERSEWLAANPYTLITMPRHKWRKDRKGTDSVTAAWFLWDKAERGFGNDTVSRTERDELKELYENSRHTTDTRDDPRSGVDTAQGAAGD